MTVAHLLSHTSGIGDYLDESVAGDIADYTLLVPVHRLASTADYLSVLQGHPTKFPAGERFEYCNGGFVILALMAEVAAQSSFYELASRRVFEPASTGATEYLRSDELPGSAAIGYLPTDVGWRTNHFHLPIRGSGDGGCYSTLGDMARFWPRIVRRQDPSATTGRRDGPPSQRRAGGESPLRSGIRLSGLEPIERRCSSRAWTWACRFGRSTTLRPRCCTRSSRIRRPALGRWSESSIDGSPISPGSQF